MQTLLTVAEAAAKLHKTPEWLRKAARQGKVPSRKVGRSRMFTDSDLDEYLDRVRQGRDPWTRSAASKSKLNSARRGGSR